MKETLSIKTTRINDRWHARLYKKEKIVDEMACNDRRDIGYICKEMLRWYDKMGGVSDMATSSRRRNKSRHIYGKVWYLKKV